jgi:ABC-type Fe3+-siderophore transport system permease subunit
VELEAVETAVHLQMLTALLEGLILVVEGAVGETILSEPMAAQAALELSSSNTPTP